MKNHTTTHAIACRIPLSLHGELKDVLQKTDMNANTFVTDAVTQYIRLIKRDTEETKQLKVARFAYELETNDK